MVQRANDVHEVCLMVGFCYLSVGIFPLSIVMVKIRVVWHRNMIA